MAENTSTPSPISSIQDSYRPNYDSHESLGFQKTRRRTYSLANSLSQTELHNAEAGQPQEAHDSEAYISGMNMSSDVASNTAADMSMTSIALADDDRTESANTTRLLQRALTSNPKWDSGLEKFTDFPPRGVRHADYNRYVDELPDDTSAYTQVLIWCLTRRIEHLRKAPPEKLRVSLLLVNVLQNLQHKLQAGLVSPTPAYRQPLKLKPRMSNPSNEWYLVVRERLQAAYDRIHETTHESYNIAGHFEKLGMVPSPELSDMQTPDLEFENLLDTHNIELQTQLAGILQNINTLDGVALESREMINECVDLRENTNVSELGDPESILKNTIPKE